MRPGNTPLVELPNLAPSGSRLFAKLEWYNPTGSVKDRAAWYMFQNAVEDGKLQPGEPMIEPTSGNTGIGLARLARIHHHPMIIVLPADSTEERRQLLRAYGAELVEVEGGPNGAIARARELADEGEGHMAYQYGNPWNTYAHFFGTSTEIVRDWPLDRPPDHFFAPYGTGGTITGNGRGLRLRWPDLVVHVVEEVMSDPIGGMRSREDPFQPPIADLSVAHYGHEITKTVAETMVGEVMVTEGMFVGTSAGAVIHAAVEFLGEHGGTAVSILPDAGWKYLSGRPWTSGVP